MLTPAVLTSAHPFRRHATLLLLLILSGLAATPGRAAISIPGLFPTGVDNAGALLPAGALDPHWLLVTSPDPAFPGPNTYVVNEAWPVAPNGGGPWLANGPSSKWIAPQAPQGTGNLPGDYVYRLTFNLTGFEPATAQVTVRFASDNAGTAVRLNGLLTGLTGTAGFGALGNPYLLASGFVEGTNTLDFVINNAGTGANPTGFRAELSGTAEAVVPPGTPPSILNQPAPTTAGLGDSASFSVGALGSRPLRYQWRFQGNPLPGETNFILTLTDVSAANAGAYSVAVANDFGSVTSSNATLSLSLRLGPSSRRTSLVFSEIMYHPAPRPDGRNLEFIELHNSNPFPEDLSGWRLSGAVDYTFPPGTVLAGEAYLVVAAVPADLQAVHGLTNVLGGYTNQLGNDGATLRLRKKSGGIVLETAYRDDPPWPVAADGAGHSLVLRDPSWGEADPRAWDQSSRPGGSPGGPDLPEVHPLAPVRINEVLARAVPPASDFIELHNGGTGPANLAGCVLTDDANTNKYRFPAGTTLPAGGRLALNATQLGFSLADDGTSIFFLAGDDGRALDALRLGGQPAGLSTGRWPDGGPDIRTLSAPTPGGTNAPPFLSPVVINEIQYHPVLGREGEEFVEVHNRSGQPVDLGGWRFTDGIDFTFPPGWTLPAGGYAVVAADAARLQARYPALGTATLAGSYQGRLSGGGERLVLARPEFLVRTNAGLPLTNRFYAAMNEVRYADGGRWGKWSDGGGSSLELIDARADNRLAPNWADSSHDATTNWTLVEATGVADLPHGGVPAADQLQILLQGAGEAIVDDVEVLVAGANRVTNPGFDAGTTGWFFTGSHVASTYEPSGGFTSPGCLHLISSVRGDHVANRARTVLSSTIPAGTLVTLRARVRWLRGHPEILLRLRGGHLEAIGNLSLPAALGSPGASNRRALPNAAPAITDVQHAPVLPQANQSIRVTARLHDPDGIASAVVRYRLDPDATLFSAPMNDLGTQGDAQAGDGVFTALLPGRPAGTLVAFRVEATDGASPGAGALFPSDAPTRECLVRVGETRPGGAFAAYRLWLRAADIATWNTREKMSNHDLDATFVYADRRVVHNAGAHYSGSSYTSPGYSGPLAGLCGYDVNLPGDDAVLGDTHFTLDWPIRDDTDQREQLMFWTLEQMGLPNMYRRYIQLFVNGQKRGTIYDDVQQPDGDTIAQWFPDDAEGDLLKTDCWNEFNETAGDGVGRIDPCVQNSLEVFTSGGVKKVGRYRWNWRPRAFAGSANDFTNLFHLVDAMTVSTNLLDTAGAPAGAYRNAVAGVVDVEHWMRTFCMNDLAAFWDAFGNPNAKNTFLYKPQRDGWKLMSWDFDVGFGVFNDPVNSALFPALGDPSMNTFYAQPAWLRLYWCALQEALDTFFNTGPGTAIDAFLDGRYAAFQANGLALNNPSGIKSWISQRRAFLQSQLATVATNFSAATPASTNAPLLTLSGSAPVTVHTLTVNGVAYTPVWTSVTTWRLTLPAPAGNATLTVLGFDRLGRPVAGASNLLSVASAAVPAPPEDNVVIHEIMYHPARPDAGYVELHNRSTNTAFDLSGWRLEGVDLTFPAGTVLNPRGYLVVCSDRAGFGNAYGWHIPVAAVYPGQLDNGGETLSLIRPGPVPGLDLLVDRVTYDDDAPWPLRADGLGPSLQLIDPAQDNNRVANWGDGAGWRFFSYTASSGPAPATTLSLWLANAGEVYVDQIALVAGNVPEAGSNLLANASFEQGLAPWIPIGNHAASAVVTGPARDGTNSLRLSATGTGIANASAVTQMVANVALNTTNTFSFWFLPSTTTATALHFRVTSSIRSLTPVDVRPVQQTPGAANSIAASLPPFPTLWLSEVQPANPGPTLDNAGDRDPWIELHNGGPASLDLTGFTLAANPSNANPWPLPPGLTLPPGGFLLVWADAEPDESTAAAPHAPFTLNPTNGSVVLAQNGRIVDYLHYRGNGTNGSFGRWPQDQASYRQPFAFPTPGQTNNPSAPPVTLFLNEWMAANSGAFLDPADGAPDDWFEIHNPTAATVDLAGFLLSDNPANPAKFTVPPGTLIPAQGHLLVWADEETGQNAPGADLHVNFKLSQSGETILLHHPDGQLVDSVAFGPQSPNVSQGRWPDGAPAPFREFPASPTPRAPNTLPGTANPVTLQSIQVAPGSATLAWTAEAGRTYRVQFKNTLLAPAWTDLPGDIPAAGPVAQKTDPSLGTNAQRFYRVVTLP